MRKLRDQLKHMFRWFTLRIRGGPLVGMKWIAWCSKRMLNGNYEPAKTAAILESVLPGQTTYDIGGHVGYYAILQSKIVGAEGHVFCFEPRPLNIEYLKRHIKINSINNVTLVESAVSDKQGQARFEDSVGTGTGYLSDRGSLSVRTTRIDSLIEKEGYPIPDFIKLDVEGGEIAAIHGAENTIVQHRPRMLIATHGDREHQFVLDFLNRHQYEIQILNPSATKGDTEILARPLRRAG